MAAPPNCEDTLSMILVMGVTGSGKSTFINTLAGEDVVRTSAKLSSCTATCQAVPMNIGKSKAIFIDTPGFDDSMRSDSEILMEISRLLSIQREGLIVKGIIYLHRITDPKMAGSSINTLEIFKRICGKEALTNVVLVTTRWNEVDENLGANREQELRENFWAFMLDHGSSMARYHNDRGSALGLASQLVSKDSIVLELQKELIEQGKPLNCTTAGSFVGDKIVLGREQSERELQNLGELRLTLKDSDRGKRRKAQKDSEMQQQRLRGFDADEEALQCDVVAQTRKVIDDKIDREHSIGLWVFVPLVPTLVGVVELFARIPPGCAPVLDSWLPKNSVARWTCNFLSNITIRSGHPVESDRT